MKKLVQRILELGHDQPEKLAVAFKKEQMSYGELAQAVLGMGQFLQNYGISKGERICFTAVSKPEMIVVYLGIQACGGVAVFLDKNSTAENMALICSDAESSLLLTDKTLKGCALCCPVLPLRHTVQQAMALSAENFQVSEESENGLAELLFTTGTTGKPKGVMLTYKAVYSILNHTIRGIGICPDERLLLPLPLNHSYALRVLRAVLWQGATVILQNGFTFAKEVENNINLFHCTALAAVPASYEIMKAQMQDQFVPVIKKLRYLEFGAGSLSVRQRKEIVELLPDLKIYNTWGSSETGGAIFCKVHEQVKDSARIASLGKPLDDISVQVLDNEGKPFKSSLEQPGRMALRGDMIMSGYWNNKKNTAEALKDGWLLTGDLVYADEEGYIFMLGRADDIINVGGEKVSPIEVENIAGQFHDIRECAVIAAEDPDGILGQVPIMFVSVNMNYSEKEFRTYLSEKLEKYKQPREIIVLDTLPRNRMQKLDRRTLRDMYENRNMYDVTNSVVQLIFARHSVRKFQEKPVPREILEILVKAGYHAPSGHNMQSWRFTVLTNPVHIMKLKEATQEASQANKVHFFGFENPQALILVSNDVRNPDGCQDASCAAENIMLAAASYGIGSVWLNPLMTLRDANPVKEILDSMKIPTNHNVWAMIALGYPLMSSQQMLKKKENVVVWVDDLK